MTLSHIQSIGVTPVAIKRVISESTTWYNMGATAVCGELIELGEYAFMDSPIPHFKADAVGIATTGKSIYAYRLC